MFFNDDDYFGDHFIEQDDYLDYEPEWSNIRFDRIVDFFKTYYMFLEYDLKGNWFQMTATVGKYVGHVLVFFLCEAVKAIETYLAVLYALFVTCIIKFLFMFLIAYLVDTFDRFFRMYFKKKRRPQYHITWVDRVQMLVSVVYPISELFLLSSQVTYGVPICEFLEHHLFRGVMLFISYTPFNLFIYSWVAYQLIIRRMGPDTHFGYDNAPEPAVWFKYVVRYVWCYMFLWRMIFHVVTTVLHKSGMIYNMSDWKQEELATGIFCCFICYYMYAIVLGFFGIEPYFPFIHDACIYHCGYKKKGKDDDDKKSGKKKK